MNQSLIIALYDQDQRKGVEYPDVRCPTLEKFGRTVRIRTVTEEI